MEKHKKTCRKNETIRKKMKKRTWTGVFGALLLASALKAPVFALSPQRSDRSFDQMKIATLSEETFYEYVASLEEALNENMPGQELFTLFDEAYSYLLQKAQNIELMDVFTNLDMTKVYETYAEEKSEYTEWDDALSLIGQKICSSQEYEQEAKEHFGEKTFEAYKSYKPLTQEQKELLDQINEISTQVDKIRATASISYAGSSYTLAELQNARIEGLLTDQSYYSIYYKLCDSIYDEVADDFIKMVSLRNSFAQSMEYENYMAYAYKEVYNRDYTYEQAKELRQRIVEALIPEYEQTQERLLQLEDSATTQEDMDLSKAIGLVKSYLPLIDPDFSSSLQYMFAHNLCDLSAAGEKVSFSFVQDLNYDNVPFLSIHGVSDLKGLGVFVHELGHFNADYHSSAEYWRNMYNNIDVAEIHSQGNELLFSMFYEKFVQDPWLEQAKCIFQVEDQMIYSSMMDAIEYDMYTDENLRPIDINASYAKWVKTYFGYDIEPDTTAAKIWIMEDVWFSNPCYYISYVVSGYSSINVFSLAADRYLEGIMRYKQIVENDCTWQYLNMLEELELSNPFKQEDFENWLFKLKKYQECCNAGECITSPVLKLQDSVKYFFTEE